MNPNDPAFPHEGAEAALKAELAAKMPPELKEHIRSFIQHWDGLTKREYFAAMAMQSVMKGWPISSKDYPMFAKECVDFADALIAELSKETK